MAKLCRKLKEQYKLYYNFKAKCLWYSQITAFLFKPVSKKLAEEISHLHAPNGEFNQRFVSWHSSHFPKKGPAKVLPMVAAPAAKELNTSYAKLGIQAIPHQSLY